jgi:hypothetical protein
MQKVAHEVEADRGSREIIAFAPKRTFMPFDSIRGGCLERSRAMSNRDEHSLTLCFPFRTSSGHREG